MGDVGPQGGQGSGQVGDCCPVREHLCRALTTQSPSVGLEPSPTLQPKASDSPWEGLTANLSGSAGHIWSLSLIYLFFKQAFKNVKTILSLCSVIKPHGL